MSDSPFIQVEEIAELTGLSPRWIKREGPKAGITPRRPPGFRKSVYIRAEVIAAIAGWPKADRQNSQFGRAARSKAAEARRAKRRKLKVKR